MKIKYPGLRRAMESPGSRGRASPSSLRAFWQRGWPRASAVAMALMAGTCFQARAWWRRPSNMTIREVTSKAMSSRHAFAVGQPKGISMAGKTFNTMARTGPGLRAFGPMYAVEAPSTPDAAVIWLHGLGDTGEGWSDVGPQLQQQLRSVRFLFPTAPTQPVTVNMGMSMPSWFDINSLDPQLFRRNPPGLAESADYVRQLIKEQIDDGIEPGRIILAGFSQGGAVVLEAALGTTDFAVGGILVLSSFLGTELPVQLPSPLPAIHFFHGQADQVVPISWGERSLAELKANDIHASFKAYPGMQHSACAEELQDIAAALTAVLVLAMLEAIDCNRLVNAQSLTQLFRWEAVRPTGSLLLREQDSFAGSFQEPRPKERTTLVATPGQKPREESRGPESTAYVSSSPRIRWGSTDIVVTTPLKFCEELAHFKEDGLYPACVVMDEADALFQGFTRVYLFEIFGALRPRPKIRQADEERQRLPDMIPTQRRAQIQCLPHRQPRSADYRLHMACIGPLSFGRLLSDDVDANLSTVPQAYRTQVSNGPSVRAHELCAMQQPTDDGDAQQGELPTVRTAARELGLLLASVVLLSFDELNPVKVLCSYTSWFMGFSEVHLGVFASLLLLALGINQRDHILYNCARIFFRCTFNNIFFRSVEIVGMENLPKEGPVIITGNHNNQFVDGLMLLTNCPREISFMIAQKSYDRPFVGFLARAFHCIPVARPQDMAYTGQGTIKLEQGSAKVQGIDTHFNVEVPPGSQINVQGHEKLLKVKEVHSSTELTVDVPATCSLAAAGFKVHPKVDQSAVYGQVYKNLCSGNCLGIFPEGGSHDRTDLLPLKAGVAVIALEALRLHHINVPIVPVGLNYFRGHQFGGRVAACMNINWTDANHGFGRFPHQVMEFGEVHAMYETNRREATEEVLNQVAAAMRSAPSSGQSSSSCEEWDFHILTLALGCSRSESGAGVVVEAALLHRRLRPVAEDHQAVVEAAEGEQLLRRAADVRAAAVGMGAVEGGPQTQGKEEPLEALEEGREQGEQQPVVDEGGEGTVESPKQTLSLPVQTRGRGVSKTVFSPKTPLGRPKLQNRGQDVEAGDKNSRLAALAAWNAAADAERLEASMRRRHSTKQREIPALGRAIRVAEKNAPRGHYDAPQQHRSPVAGIMAVTSIAVKMGETESQREKEYVASERERKREPPLCCFTVGNLTGRYSSPWNTHVEEPPQWKALKPVDCGCALTRKGGGVRLPPLRKREREREREHKQILTARTSMHSRAIAHTTLVRNAGLYACETWPPHHRILKGANSQQIQHYRDMLHINRRPAEDWATWNSRSLRHARLYMHREKLGRWSTYILHRIWSLWGHMARGGEEVEAMVAWKNLAFWRGEQQKPRSQRVSHAARFNPEGDVERALEAIAGTNWMGVAQDRHRWGELASTFVARFDVPWATGRQTSIRDNLTPNSKHTQPKGELAAE
ncbi:SCT1 [Symbiodinium necroappetens]|uniref:SCT1 protein n=1 Tax=Symbiodinium necroappetens TaxID=1628268 RepID=A0A812X1V5_9DINO|nr:SCT1 [Symbiodinium necroappetens]